MSDNAAKTLVWGGGSCLKLLEPYLAAVGRKSDFIFADQANYIAPPELLTRKYRPDIYEAAAQCDAYVVCIGDAHGKRRTILSELLRSEYELKPLSLIHPTAYICPTAQFTEPVFIMPHAVVNSYAKIGSDCIINTNAVIEHESIIERGVHVMGSAVVTGRCILHQFSTIGTNATILPDLIIGESAYVGAGAVVTKNVHPSEVVTGIPAKAKH